MCIRDSHTSISLRNMEVKTMLFIHYYSKLEIDITKTCNVKKLMNETGLNTCLITFKEIYVETDTLQIIKYFCTITVIILYSVL